MTVHDDEVPVDPVLVRVPRTAATAGSLRTELRWLDGTPADAAALADPAAFGRDLAGFVAELHALDLTDPRRAVRASCCTATSSRPTCSCATGA